MPRKKQSATQSTPSKAEQESEVINQEIPDLEEVSELQQLQALYSEMQLFGIRSISDVENKIAQLIK